MKRILISVVLASLFISANVSAADGKSIAAKNACLGCHAVDKKLVGPAYQDVAAKYKGQADAVAKLMKKVKAGGSGVWGPVPMPANPGLSDADLKAVVEWVLAGAK
jgi:cytochrome c